MGLSLIAHSTIVSFFTFLFSLTSESHNKMVKTEFFVETCLPLKVSIIVLSSRFSAFSFILSFTNLNYTWLQIQLRCGIERCITLQFNSSHLFTLLLFPVYKACWRELRTKKTIIRVNLQRFSDLCVHPTMIIIFHNWSQEPQFLRGATAVLIRGRNGLRLGLNLKFESEKAL